MFGYGYIEVGHIPTGPDDTEDWYAQITIPKGSNLDGRTLALAASPSTSGNLAALDADGNPVDSGVAKTDVPNKRDKTDLAVYDWTWTPGDPAGGGEGTKFTLSGDGFDNPLQFLWDAATSKWKAVGPSNNVYISETATGFHCDSIPYVFAEGFDFSLDAEYTYTVVNGNYTRIITGYTGTLVAGSDTLAAAQQIAPAFDATRTSQTKYNKNELVTKDGVVYQCTNVSGHWGAWNASNWTAKPVSELFLPITGGEPTGVINFVNKDEYPGGGLLTLKSNDRSVSINIGLLNDGRIVLYGTGGGYFLPELTQANLWRTLAFAASPTTSGNLAALDASGNLTDSGIAPSAKLDSTSVAPAFATSATYSVGEHVTHEGRLYECSEAVTASGAWDSSKWTDDDMTSPDATLDITPNGQLRLVSANGEQLWAQGYDLATESSSSLRCDRVNLFAFEATTASAFSDSATYSVGERVAYSGKVYACTTAVATAGAWTGSTNWDEDPDTQSFEMPSTLNGKVGDFIVDIDNTANTVETAAALDGLGNSFSVVVQKGESVLDLLTFAPGELSELYFTQTAFRVNDLPTWKLVKNVVEDGGAE